MHTKGAPSSLVHFADPNPRNLSLPSATVVRPLQEKGPKQWPMKQEFLEFLTAARETFITRARLM